MTHDSIVTEENKCKSLVVGLFCSHYWVRLSACGGLFIRRDHEAVENRAGFERFGIADGYALVATNASCFAPSSSRE